MWFALGALAIGILLGRLARNKFQKSVFPLILVTVCILLLLMGLRIGGNKNLIDSLSSIGIISVILVIFALLGSLFATKFATKWIDGEKRTAEKNRSNER